MPVCVGSKKRFGGRGGAGGTVVVLGLVFVGFVMGLFDFDSVLLACTDII